MSAVPGPLNPVIRIFDTAQLIGHLTDTLEIAVSSPMYASIFL